MENVFMIDINDYLSYDESSGDLIWAFKLSRKVVVGSVAGCKCKRDGYIKVRFENRLYLAHRIIWESVMGRIPEGMQIDHINHNRSDNRMENLRLVTHIENGMNQSRSVRNKSGVTGVSWQNRDKKWRSVISKDRKVIILGYFNNFDDAVATRLSAEIEFGYHVNHGRKLKV